MNLESIDALKSEFQKVMHSGRHKMFVSRTDKNLAIITEALISTNILDRCEVIISPNPAEDIEINW